MDKKIFQTSLSRYFSSHVIFYAFLASCAGLYLIIDNELIGGLTLILISLIFFTAQYGLEIDLENKTYRKFGKIVGLKIGERLKFDTIDYLFINSGKVSQTMNYKSLSTTIDDMEFNGYIKFDDKTKLFLLNSKSKDKLIKKLKMISKSVDSKLIDYSNGEQREI